MFLAKPSRLHDYGLLGMNQRNISYISRYNPRRLYPRVDDKMETKLLAEAAGIAVPRLLASISMQFQVKQLDKILDAQEAFVVKPAKGSAGKGILVIVAKQGQHYVKASGQEVSFKDIERHVSNILSGLYSLGGKPDVAMFEALVEFDPVFDNYSFQGVPDIRVIIFQGYPVMAMLRLSTKSSDGKANLHQGAVGVGIDLATGRAVNAVQYDAPVKIHPDTNYNFDELEIPHWERLLPLASSCFEVTELGYMGADIVLDKNKGPLILELNARPGLAIQIANNQGLLPRLQLIEKQRGIQRSVEERVAFSIEHFCQNS
ncbi:alpha-L-glutamate ligase-like protein [Sinobacterium caligoides]|uniref:Alpha-L-glutamate ligase-like protein n=1 Tax=Sinobacterium caligoides TaxID=933926 RepID=A0A3N2D5F8_9GAMM|nr:alpha-L-glutamate ligase-like protein [Sinobacterium caligoides]ROR94868.1 alpha-L-glutamate ligase-like protein [Sinobacterium caligoides]